LCKEKHQIQVELIRHDAAAPLPAQHLAFQLDSKTIADELDEFYAHLHSRIGGSLGIEPTNAMDCSSNMSTFDSLILYLTHCCRIVYARLLARRLSGLRRFDAS
jgi:hypothetical protein